jgi:hypothetical protein
MLRGEDDVDGVVVCFGGVKLPPFVPSLDEGRRGVVFWLIMSVNLRVKEAFLGEEARMVIVDV